VQQKTVFTVLSDEPDSLINSFQWMSPFTNLPAGFAEPVPELAREPGRLAHPIEEVLVGD